MEYIEITIINLGLFAIFILMFTNGLLSAPPSELTLAAAGFWAHSNNVSLLKIVIMGTTGNLFGTLFLYYIGYYFGHAWLFRFKEKHESSSTFYLRKTSSSIPQKALFDFLLFKFNASGLHWLGILRCFPTVRSVISLPAGMAKVNLMKFISYSSFGILVWNLLWSSLGYIVKSSWQNYHWPISISLITLLVILALLLKKRLSAIINDFESSLTMQTHTNH